MKKSNSLELKHHKEFHKLNLTKLDVKVRNIFMMLCFELMEQQEEEISYTLKQLLEVGGIKKNLKKDEKINFVVGAFESLNKIALFRENEEELEFINLFSKLGYNKATEIALFKINKDFIHLLNDVQKPFTVQKLIEYKSLKSKYSQLMYSLLKQWEGIEKKEKIWDLKELEKLLGVPENYGTANFNRQVLKPIQEELTPLFSNLKITKDNGGTKKTQSIKFSWGTGRTIKKDTDMTEKKLTIPKMKNKAELLEQLKATEKADKKKKATQELINKQLEEKENIRNDQLEGFKKAKKLMEEQLRVIEVSTNENESDLKANESLEINEIEQLEKEIFELGITKTSFRLIKADMKRFIKLNTMKNPKEEEILKTVLGVLKEIKDPFNVTMSESDLKVIREQAKKYKIKLEW